MSPSSAHIARSGILRDEMERAGIDALLVYGNAWHADSLRYATDFGIQEGQALALVGRDGATTLLLDDRAEADRARAEGNCEVVFAPKLIEAARDLLSRAGNRSVAATPWRLMPYGLTRDARDLRISDGAVLLEHLLMGKRDFELAAARRAAALADEGYKVFRDAARPGRKDYELIAEIEAFFRAHRVPENFMIIGVGGVEVRGMAPPVGKVIKEGDLVTTELTPCVDGYYAQVCRTLVSGTPSETQLKSFAVFQEALEAGLAAVKSGVAASAIAKAENDVFRAHGLGDYVTSEYTRVRGHGIGLFPDQRPQILEDVHLPIVGDSTIIVHPNTYHPDAGYMVLGDTIIARANGHERLGGLSRELFSVPVRE
jgi:Xaa-Pro aminopeptidase